MFIKFSTFLHHGIFQAFGILDDIGAKVKTSSRKRTHKDENEREKESKRARVKEEKEQPPVESKPPPPPPSGPNNTVSPGQIQAQQVNMEGMIR